MRKLVLVGVLAALVVLAGCASQAPGSSSSSSASSSSSSSSVVTAGAEDVVTISLDYAAGTGFEWTCSAEPEGVVSQVGQETVDRSATSEPVSGGPLQERFTFRAVKPGEVVLTFTLARSWEAGDPAETQVYAFTVTDDLKMVLNPYKSDFTNEPEWGSNS